MHALFSDTIRPSMDLSCQKLFTDSIKQWKNCHNLIHSIIIYDECVSEKNLPLAFYSHRESNPARSLAKLAMDSTNATEPLLILSVKVFQYWLQLQSICFCSSNSDRMRNSNLDHLFFLHDGNKMSASSTNPKNGKSFVKTFLRNVSCQKMIQWWLTTRPPGCKLWGSLG